MIRTLTFNVSYAVTSDVRAETQACLDAIDFCCMVRSLHRRDHINAPYLRLMTGIAAPLGNEMKPTTKCVSFRAVVGDAAVIMVVQPFWVRTLSR
ncbi:unnamed protein product [Toxocara canis]|uniref:Endonuclease/exonuclease/phosphatase n=1 Tax=Toxocara canis TaxID=6265 RepID=A0A183U938_TOXCA|nr:unnamed protein product [Toxocara canis]